ncbi:hypothetical protein JTB14_027837 [Gonioctena quinquepunctata]|nr:hypothetical protein JTB14_027837 [Gonioctena quinquepunctata]
MCLLQRKPQTPEIPMSATGDGEAVCSTAGKKWATDCVVVELPLVPVPISNNELTNTIEEEEDDEENDLPLLADDSTTHGLERLSSAATCLVAGVEYTHGQQVRIYVQF